MIIKYLIEKNSNCIENIYHKVQLENNIEFDYVYRKRECTYQI